MKLYKLLSRTVVIYCLFSLFSVNAEPKFPDNMEMKDMVDVALAQIKDSPYKSISVLTESGTMTGEFVKRSGDVLILKTDTGAIHLGSGKAKFSYVMVDVNKVISVEFFGLE